MEPSSSLFWSKRSLKSPGDKRLQTTPSAIERTDQHIHLFHSTPKSSLDINWMQDTRYHTHLRNCFTRGFQFENLCLGIINAFLVFSPEPSSFSRPIISKSCNCLLCSLMSHFLLCSFNLKEKRQRSSFVHGYTCRTRGVHAYDAKR
jgi:hypothetical protein